MSEERVKIVWKHEECRRLECQGWRLAYRHCVTDLALTDMMESEVLSIYVAPEPPEPPEPTLAGELYRWAQKAPAFAQLLFESADELERMGKIETMACWYSDVWHSNEKEPVCLRHARNAMFAALDDV